MSRFSDFLRGLGFMALGGLLMGILMGFLSDKGIISFSTSKNIFIISGFLIGFFRNFLIIERWKLIN